MKQVFKFLLVELMIFSLVICFIMYKKNLEFNKLNKEYFLLVNEIEENQSIITALEVINNEGLTKQDKIDKLNARLQELNTQNNKYISDIDRLNKELNTSK